MKDFIKVYKSLSHTKWDCKYHIVFIPKNHRKAVYGKIKSELGRFFHELAKHKESEIVEGHLCTNHIHMCISIPPKYAVSNVVDYIKGKSTIMIARTLMGVKEILLGKAFGLVNISFLPSDWMK